MPAVTRLIQTIDPAQPIAVSTTIRGLVSEELARPRLKALLAIGFGFAALALAALGISAALAEDLRAGRRLAAGSDPGGGERSDPTQQVLGNGH